MVPNNKPNNNTRNNKKNNTRNNRKNNKKNNRKNNTKNNKKNNTRNNNRRSPSPIFYMNSPNRKFSEERLPNTPQSVNSSTNTIKQPSPEIINPFVFNMPPKILRSLMNDKNLF